MVSETILPSPHRVRPGPRLLLITADNDRKGSPDFAREIAFQKITNRIKGANMASKKLDM